MKKWKVITDTLFTSAILFLADIICVVLRNVSDSLSFIPMIFVLCVLLVSLVTDGYAYGVAASIIAVLGVNFVFTYPYMAFNFIRAGYPVIFLTMLSVSITTCMLTGRLKKQEDLRIVSERERMRSDMFRAMSHDLRTPLASIEGSADLILENEDMPLEERASLLLGIKENAEWLIRMAENMLTVTRMVPDGLAMTKSEELPEEITGEVSRKFRQRFPDIALEVYVPEEAFFVPMDPVLIEQVLMNLLDNSVEHGKTTKKISLSCEKLETYAQFIVTDDGQGIDDDILKRLFTDYIDYAQRESDTNGKHNTGIGLYVSSQIIHAHGGEIWANNMRGGGAQICFTLPLFEADSNED